MPPVLAYVEHCLPGATLEDRVALARRLDLALEVAHRTDVDLARLRRSGVTPATLQAYGMHDAHPLHEDPERRTAAAPVLRAAIEAAAEFGVRRVIAACGFGPCAVDRPFERCCEFFARAGAAARANGVRVLVEPLSPLRAGAMTEPAEIQRLLDVLDAPDVFGTVLDVGHLLDGGHEPVDVLRGWRHRVDELQLRGRGSRPPEPDAPVREWLGARASCPDVVAVEHRTPIGEDELVLLVRRLRTTLSDLG